jgi:hypothetical protein
MKSIYLFIAIASVTSLACDGSKSPTPDSSRLQSEERALIDNQANKIDLLAQNLPDYCDAVGRLDELPRLAATEGGRGYASLKQAELKERLDESAYKLLIEAANVWLTQQNISKAFADETVRLYGPEWEIVSSTKPSPTIERNGDAVKLEYTYQLSLRDKVFLGSDNFMTKKGHLIVKASPDCSGRSRSGVHTEFTAHISD